MITLKKVEYRASILYIFYQVSIYSNRELLRITSLSPFRAFIAWFDLLDA